MRDFVRARFGHDKPKQYCSFIGKRSLLQHTVDRADRMSSAAHRVLVAARHHRSELARQMESRPAGTVLLQPRNLGTAPGVFLPLSHVLAKDSEATVAIFPSDHFVYPESRLLEELSKALLLSHELAGRPILIGVEPERAESEYGWIEAGTIVGVAGEARARAVERFTEKPPREIAERIAREGGLWNTSILVAKAETIWELGWRHLPEMMPFFVEIREAFKDQPSRIEPLLDQLYTRIPPRDFSRNLMEPSASQLAVTRLDRCCWSDWGSPARILETLSRLPAAGRATPLESPITDAPTNGAAPMPAQQA